MKIKMTKENKELVLVVKLDPSKYSIASVKKALKGIVDKKKTKEKDCFFCGNTKKLKKEEVMLCEDCRDD